MVRKPIPSVRLERQAHRDAKERLRQAYQLLLQAKLAEQACVSVMDDEKEKSYQEVQS